MLFRSAYFFAVFQTNLDNAVDICLYAGNITKIFIKNALKGLHFGSICRRIADVFEFILYLTYYILLLIKHERIDFIETRSVPGIP